MPKETISSVYQDLDQLSNYLARTFQTFQTQKATHARFFEENEEQRQYASQANYANNNFGEKGYMEISAQGFNGPRSSNLRNSNNYYTGSKNYQRGSEEREKVWYNLPEKELLQRYMFREDDIRGSTPFYDQSRGYNNRRLPEIPQKRDVHPDSGYNNKIRSPETPQKRHVHPDSEYGAHVYSGYSGYSGEMNRREQITNNSDFRYQGNADAEEKYYEPLYNQTSPVVKQGRNIKELYRYQSRHRNKINNY